MNIKDIEIMVSSDCNYEECVIEMYYKRKFIGRLNQDAGLDNVVIELPEDKGGIDKNMLAYSVPLEVFEKALAMAKDRLTQGSSIVHLK